jgi:hypothetical protein
MATLSLDILYPPCLHAICGIPDSLVIQKNKGFATYEGLAESMLQEINRYKALLTINTIEGEYMEETISGEGLYFTVIVEYQYPIKVEFPV